MCCYCLYIYSGFRFGIYCFNKLRLKLVLRINRLVVEFFFKINLFLCDVLDEGVVLFG